MLFTKGQNRSYYGDRFKFYAFIMFILRWPSTRNIHQISGSHYRLWSLRLISFTEKSRIITDNPETRSKFWNIVRHFRAAAFYKYFKTICTRRSWAWAKIYLEAITYDICGYYWSFLLYGILFYKQKLNFFTLSVHRHRNMYVLLSFSCVF